MDSARPEKMHTCRGAPAELSGLRIANPYRKTRRKESSRPLPALPRDGSDTTSASEAARRRTPRSGAWTSLSFNHPLLVPPPWVANVKRLARTPVRLEGAVLACMRGQADANWQRAVLLDELRRLDMPALVVRGHSALVLPYWQADAAAARLRRAGWSGCRLAGICRMSTVRAGSSLHWKRFCGRRNCPAEATWLPAVRTGSRHPPPACRKKHMTAVTSTPRGGNAILRLAPGHRPRFVGPDIRGALLQLPEQGSMAKLQTVAFPLFQSAGCRRRRCIPARPRAGCGDGPCCAQAPAPQAAGPGRWQHRMTMASFRRVRARGVA
jgi:hypothetical protein